MAARASSNVSCDSIDAYRKLLRMGSSFASVVASFLRIVSMCCFGSEVHCTDYN